MQPRPGEDASRPRARPSAQDIMTNDTPHTIEGSSIETRGSERARRGGRSANARRGGAAVSQLPWGVTRNFDPPTEPLPPEGVLAIHEAAMTILEEIGIEFLNFEAIEVLEREGKSAVTIDKRHADGARVRMGRDFVMEKLALAPSSFTLTPRNPARALPFGGNHVIFASIASPPNYSDMETGRVAGTREHFRRLVKLTHYFNCVHVHAGYQVEPLDSHPSVRHLDCLQDQLTLSDKVVHAYSLGSERIEDAMEMVRIAAGLTPEEFAAAPRMFTNINSTSPLKHDKPMLDGAMRMARKGQPTIVTPFTLAGAMSPITMAGTVAQSIAEALIAVVLLQCVKPGTPCAIGTFSSNVDMKTGAPAFGTPDYIRATQMTGQMARFYKLPLRSSNTNATNCVDAQAMIESSHSLFAALTSGTNFVYHAAGWLEGGLCASFEKFIIDCEQIQQLQAYMKPVDWSAEALALDTVREVGPGGHFFGTQHTQERYETAFYSPFLSDWSNFENWRDAGSVQTFERAFKLGQRILNEFEPAPMDDTIRAELEDFVARRKSEGGAPTDF
jgi:trimethylamine--corrinoid protein Co-methyltransferase